jgi:hypothetical protein
MRTLRSTIVCLATLAVVTLLAGCGSSGIGDILGGGKSDDRYGTVSGDVRGTVERVDTRDRYIVVDREGGSYNLRNAGDETVIYYDDRTKVEYQGRTYRPEDLERGDRIAANVDQSGSRLIAENIQVLQDVSGGGLGDDFNDRELRGVVRYVDTRDHTLEIEPSRDDSRYSTNRSGVVVVHYDSGTTVEYQGHRYTPENLERGDEVEIKLRDLGGQLHAEQIVVLGEDRSVTR